MYILKDVRIFCNCIFRIEYIFIGFSFTCIIEQLVSRLCNYASYAANALQNQGMLVTLRRS